MPLITFEGLDCAGKTSVIAACALTLQAAEPVVLSDFSGDGLVPLKSLAVRERCTPAQIHLFMAARIITHRTVVAPLLETRALILYDRYLDSTLAYQGQDYPGVHRDESALARRLIMMEHANSQLPVPDLTLVLDITVDTMRDRMAARPGGRDQLEQRPDTYFHAAREIYMREASLSRHHVVINASRPLAMVIADCTTAIQSAIGA